MFLCQIYAPTDDLVRHLLIYGCNNGKCGNVSGSFRVLRIQNNYVEENRDDVEEESSKESESNSTSTPSWTVEGADDWNIDGADDWNVDGAGTVWLCQTIAYAETSTAAQNTPAANAFNTASGCNGGPWIEL